MKLGIQFLYMVIQKLPVNSTYSFYLQKFTKWCWTRSTQFSSLSNYPFHFWSKRHPYIYLTTGLELLSVVGIATINVCMDGLSCLTSKLFDINKWGFPVLWASSSASASSLATLGLPLLQWVLLLQLPLASSQDPPSHLPPPNLSHLQSPQH